MRLHFHPHDSSCMTNEHEFVMIRSEKHTLAQNSFRSGQNAAISLFAKMAIKVKDILTSYHNFLMSDHQMIRWS